MRLQIYKAIEPGASATNANKAYSLSMIAVIIISMIPLAAKQPGAVLNTVDQIASVIFLIDYLLRLLTSDMKMQKGLASFFIYPITPMAIIDLLSILPGFIAVSNGLRLFKLFRLFRTFRVFRAFKLARYSKNVMIIIAVIRRQKTALLAVATLSIAYILISALVIFNVEPDTFSNYFDAVYWATVSLTTVGYGDVYPVSDVGRMVAMLSSLVGIAVVALPSGIITAGYMDEISKTE